MINMDAQAMVIDYLVGKNKYVSELLVSYDNNNQHITVGHLEIR